MPLPKIKLEKTLENRCVKHASVLGWDHIKTDKAKKDYPDHFFLGPEAQILIVEFKRPGETPRKRQRVIHARLRTRGFNVYVVDDFIQFCRLFNNLHSEPRIDF